MQSLPTFSHGILAAQITGGTVIAALQAPTPEIVACFDEVVLLSDGYELFHGPHAQLHGYLSNLGYNCPHYMDIADYALSICVSPAFTAMTYPHAEHAQPAENMRTRQALSENWEKHAAAQPKLPTATGGITLDSPGAKAQFGQQLVHSNMKHAVLLVRCALHSLKRTVTSLRYES